jgi:hypothetical protein
MMMGGVPNELETWTESIEADFISVPEADPRSQIVRDSCAALIRLP